MNAVSIKTIITFAFALSLMLGGFYLYDSYTNVAQAWGSSCGGCDGGGGGGGGGGGEGPGTPPTPIIGACISFVSNPKQVPYGGGNVNLAWQTQNAERVTLSGHGDVDKNGSKTVHVTSNTTFTLTVYGQDGSTACSESVTVAPPSPVAKCNYLTADRTTVPYGGGPVVLTWSTTNATSVTINGSSNNVNGSATVNPSTDTTYTLIANGSGGSDSCTVRITVEPPTQAPKCDFLTASRSTVPPSGANVTLTWETSNASAASINNGIGSVAVDGSRTVFVDSTTTFVLTATGTGGNDNCTVTITKESSSQAPRCDYFRIAGDDDVEEGDRITLEWETTNATEVRIEPGIGNVSVDGSQNVTVYDDETYTLRARNLSTGQEATCTVSVRVDEEEEEEDDEPSPRCDLEVSRDRVNPGEKVTLSWDTKNTDEIRIRDDHGNTIFESDRSKYMDGEIDVVIYKSTEFTLRAEGDGGSRTCRVDVKTDNLAVYEKRDQGYVIALTQVPYTGFEAGPVLAFLFYGILVLWALFVAYILVIKKGSVMGFSLYGNGQGATASDIANRKKVEALVEKYSGRLWK